MNVYNVVSTQDETSTDENGVTATIPAGSVVNTIIWDGVSEYDPGPNLKLVKVSE